MNTTAARQLLGVSADASEADIKEAYREKTKEEHPDQSDDPEATERFKNIKQARDTLLEERNDANGSTSGTQAESNGSAQSRQSNSWSAGTTTSGDSSTSGTRSTNTEQTTNSRTGSQSGNTGQAENGQSGADGHSDPRTNPGGPSHASQESTHNASQSRQRRDRASRTPGEGDPFNQQTSSQQSNGRRAGNTATENDAWREEAPDSETSETDGRGRGHTLPRGVISATDKRVLGLSVGLLVVVIAAALPGFRNPPGSVIVGLIWIGLTAYFGMVLRRDSVEYDDLSYLSIARRYCLEGWLLPAKSYAVATVATAAVLPVLVALVFPVIDGITSGTPLFADLVTAGNNIGYFGFVSVAAPFWPPIGGFLTVLSAYLHDG